MTTLTTATSPTYTIATAQSPGAIAVIQLIGSGSENIILKLTGQLPTPRCTIANFDDIDQGFIVTMGNDFYQLMPHGGTKVVQKICARLDQLGAIHAESIDTRQTYPEARSDLDADMLAALAKASSPAAIDLLLTQPDLWYRAVTTNDINSTAILNQSQYLNHLLIPPTIALFGCANVGKSTLTNLVIGRASSITADLPGTTRDWIAGLAELPTPIGEFTVRWFDTPGFRSTDDHIEKHAIRLATNIINSADILIAVKDHQNDWPNTSILTRDIDLFVHNKSDLAPQPPHSLPSTHLDKPLLHISALHQNAPAQLGHAIATYLNLTSIDQYLPWAFSTQLQHILKNNDTEALAKYATPEG